MPDPDYQDLYGKAVHELRTLREKQARTKYEVRYLKDRVTDLRAAMTDALAALEGSGTDSAAEALRAALQPSQEPDADHVPEGARNQRRARAKS